jgi:hypothetical protein
VGTGGKPCGASATRRGSRGLASSPGNDRRQCFPVDLQLSGTARFANRLFYLPPAWFCCFSHPLLGRGAPNGKQLPGQWPRLVKPGTALDLCTRNTAFLPLLLGQLLAIGFRGGSQGRPRAELLGCARVSWFDIPAPALFAVPHIVNPFTPSPTSKSTI